MASLARLQYRAEAIGNFYQASGRDRAGTVRHFLQQNIARSVIYRAIDKIETTGDCTFRAIPGRPKQAKTKRAAKLIVDRLSKEPSTSVRNLARLANVSKSTVHELKIELDYKTYTKQPASKATPDQEARIKRGALKIYKKLVPSGGEKILIMDDETYVPQDPSEVPGKQFYCVRPGFPVPDETRFQRKTKYAQKFLVWQAMDQFGNVSAPFISEGTIDSSTYLEECLKKRLLPFILAHHNVNDVLFWPDMARAHYANIVVDWLASMNIAFVGHNENTPNFPSGRPIEKFWALCKKQYKQSKRMPDSLVAFERIWARVSERVAAQSGKNLMANIKTKLRLGSVFVSIGPLQSRQALSNKNSNSNV